MFGIGISFEKLGKAFEIQLDYSTVIDKQLQSLSVKEDVKDDTRGFILSLCSLARVYGFQKDWEKADLYLKRAKTDYLPRVIDDEMRGDYHRSKGLLLKKQLEETLESEIPEKTLIVLSHLEQARQIWEKTSRPCRQAEMDSAIDEVRLKYMEQSWRYCPKCGSKLDIANRMLIDQYSLCEGLELPSRRLHINCTTCDHSIFINPKIGVGVIIEVEDAGELKVVLVKRGQQPYKEWWSVVAGYTEYDESPKQTALREAMEETGVDIEINSTPFGIYTFRDDPRADMIHIVYIAKMQGGTLKAGSDALEVGLFSINQILAESKIAFEGNRQALIDWIKQKKGEEFANLKSQMKKADFDNLKREFQ